MNKKEKKKGGDYFRTPSPELEQKLMEYEQLLKAAGEMEDFETIATVSETCADIIYVLNTRHMGRYIFPKSLQALDEFHSLKINGKLIEALEYLDSIIEMKKSELEVFTSIKDLVDSKLGEKVK